jgi:hypothetical protein
VPGSPPVLKQLLQKYRAIVESPSNICVFSLVFFGIVAQKDEDEAGIQRPPRQGVQRNDMHPIAPQRRPFRPHFTCLYRLVLTRSRCAQLRKANHFLAHLALLVGPEALLVGPEALSRPTTTAHNRLGGGRPPPCAPPCAAAGRPAGLRPAEKLCPRRKIESSHRSRRTALKNQREMCYVVVLFRCVPPDMTVVVSPRGHGHITSADAARVCRCIRPPLV